MPKPIDHAGRLAGLRRDIEALKREMTQTETAPVPLSEALERVDPLVDRVAARWVPVGGDLTAATMWDVWALGGLVARVARQGLVAVLQDALRAHYGEIEAAACIPSAERPERLQALSERLYALEVEEEHAIMAGAREGIVLPRRGDADPRAVLAVLDESTAA